MTTYQAEQIRRFLRAVDRHLKEPVRLVVIGGSAALLQHGATSPTRDIDAFEGDSTRLKTAVARAEAEIGYAVPIGRAAVADLPLHYEDRTPADRWERTTKQLEERESGLDERLDKLEGKLDDSK